MKINFEQNTLQSEYFILFNMLGILHSIKNNLIDIETAEVNFFNPYTLENFRKTGVRKAILEIIELGLELNDIEKLVSVHERNFTIEKIIDKTANQLSQLPNLQYPIFRGIEE